MTANHTNRETGPLQHCDGSGNLLGAINLGSFASVGEHLQTSSRPETNRWYLSVEVGQKCQLECRHCIYSSDKEAMPNPLVNNAVSAAINGGRRFNWVSLSGKEPTYFHRELVELARVVRHPEHHVILMTNGLALKGVLLEELLPLIDCFDISIDGDKPAHEWMRGERHFDRTWRTLEQLVDRGARKIAVIATSVSALLPDGRRQVESLIVLAQRMSEAFTSQSRISLSLSLYYGAPSDPMRLSIGELEILIRGMQGLGIGIQVLVTANYSHLWPELAQRLGIGHIPVRYDRDTNIPVVVSENVRFLLFNLCESPLTTLRIANSGDIFIGCNHLTLGEDAARHRLGNLEQQGLEVTMDILSSAADGLPGRLSEVPQACVRCEGWNRCRGGDRLSGLYFQDMARDPYCPLLT